nr:hypothetical protein [uncultured Butyrivibrio sp.]
MKKIIKILIVVTEVIALTSLIVLVNYSDECNSDKLTVLQSEHIERQKAEAESEKKRKEDEIQEEHKKRIESIYERKYLLDESDGKVLIDSLDSVSLNDEKEIVFDVAGYEGIKCLMVSGRAYDNSIKIEIDAMVNEEVVEQAYFCADSKENREFYFPSVNAETFVIKNGDMLLLDEIYVYILPNNTKMQTVKAGTFVSDEVENVYLERAFNQTAGRTIACDGKIIFSNIGGTIVAWKLSEDKSLEMISQVDIKCESIWKIEIDSDRKIMVVACRSEGIYIIDYSNVYDMKMLSHYDTNELATDVSIDNNYLAIASRYFGVEIVDISDITAPKYVTDAWVAYEEFESCIMSGRYLYVGVWEQKKVEIFDLKNIIEPVLIATIDLDGKAYYMDIQNDILFVATGQHAASYFSNISDIGYGTGNGIEIFDVSNPELPVWKSTVKAKGRWCGGRYDTWGVEVAGQYAYFYDTYNGVYIYDISEVDNPKLCTEIQTPILSGDSIFELYESDKFVYNNDRTKWINSPILDLTIADGQIYLISPQTGIYTYNCNTAICEKEEQKEYNYEVKKSEFSDDRIVYKLSNENIWAVTNDDKYIYLACSDGIIVLDETYEPIYKYETESGVFDVKMYNSLIVSAEGTNGISLYEFQDGIIEKRYQIDLPENLKAKAINISNDYIVVQTERNKVVLAKVSDINNIQIIGTSSTAAGNMYYRELAQGTAGNGIVYYKGLNGIVGLSDNDGKFKEELIEKFKLAEHCGICVTDNYMYISYPDKIIKMSLDREMVEKEFPAMQGEYSLYGKLQVLGNYLICIEEISKNIAVFEIDDTTGDITYKTNVRNLIGFPDLGCIDRNGDILIPLKHEGLAKINMN